MIFNYIKNPIHVPTSWINTKNELSEQTEVNGVNLIDPILISKENTSQLTGSRFFQQLNEKIHVLAHHHKDLNKQALLIPYSTLLKNQKENISTVKLSGLTHSTQTIDLNTSLIQVYPSSADISVYKTISSLISFDTSLIKPQYLSYQFNKQNKLHTQHYITVSQILESAFLSMGYLINKPKYKRTPSKTCIHIFYYKQSKEYSHLTQSKCHQLIQYLHELLDTPIQLNITNISHIIAESTILAKALVSQSYKGRFLKIVSSLFKHMKFEEVSNIDTFTAYQFNLVPSFISGIKIRLGGRTFRQRIIPRKTVQTLQKGTLARTKARFMEKVQISHKTRRGTFTFTVYMGHAY